MAVGRQGPPRVTCTAAIDAGWDDEPAQSGVRSKPPLPLQVVARRYLLARLELEARLDSKQRVAVEVDGEAYEIVMVADAIGRNGEVVRRGGLRVERR